MSEDSTVPFNYRYFIALARQAGGTILDYGCGRGQTVALGVAAGLDIWGADTFSGHYADWANHVEPAAQGRIKAIVEELIPFADDTFDFVMSNQVLEHVRDPEAVVREVHRVLKPGGLFVAAFPVVETWYEGHIGLYFGHRFAPGTPLRRAYFDAMHRLGAGLYRGDLSRQSWVATSEKTLDDACFYYPRGRMIAAFRSAFGQDPEDGCAHYMRERLQTRARRIPGWADPLLRFVYHKRAGEIWQVRKPSGTGAAPAD